MINGKTWASGLLFSNESLRPEQKINITQGNELDLSAFADDSFDITLLLGPLQKQECRCVLETKTIAGLRQSVQWLKERDWL
ncbi:hypothetical protein Dtox_0640 [Desulfofarcimen acetoxidans DSM 771]|jgi:hypothetical protein|uniref:Uncharacterized protein n=1 Tax=Desulfofarcimen acetoxidans (strain ATCC 49208 / DSM 771 / KCTC 5769 / VKM B-1644 / 5575) TaxID=485916 RepID=C8W1B4_DESAS|nr:hypothetical protein Dtox_0640 [Desulfofarcimen acetoxidans DSM 771]